MRAGNEIRVGIVVFLALALIVGSYFYFRRVGFSAQHYTLRLSGAALVSEGNEVRLQGIKVGIVQKVALDPETQKPLLTLAINQHKPAFSLYRSYKYSVRTRGVIGENYVDISGTPEPGDTAYLADDSSQIIPGKAATGILGVSDSPDELMKKVGTALDKMSVTLDRINNGVLSPQSQMKLTKALDGVTRLTEAASQNFGKGGIKVGFGDPQTQRALNATFINAAQAANQAGLAARDVQVLSRSAGRVLDQTGGVLGQAGDVIGENRAQLKSLLVSLDRTANSAADTAESVGFLVKNSNLDKSIKNAGGSIERAAKNMEDTTASFKTMTGPDTQKELTTAIVALRESTEALRDTATSVKSLVTNTETQDQMRTALKTLSSSANDLAQTTSNLKDATSGLKNVLGDEKVQSDMKAIPAELRGTLEAARASAERLNSLLGGRRHSKKVGDNTQGESKNSNRGSALDTGFDFTYRHLGEGEKRNRGDVRFQSELFGNPFRLGLDNIGEGTDFTLQTGRYIGDNAAIRYGMYRSKLGFGADVKSGRFSLEANLYDPNDRSWNVYGGVSLNSQVELLLGREKFGDVRTNSIGVRLRR